MTVGGRPLDLTAEEVGENAYAAEENAQAQVIEVEQAGEYQAVFADGVAVRMAAEFQEPVQQRESHGAERDEAQHELFHVVIPPVSSGATGLRPDRRGQRLFR